MLLDGRVIRIDTVVHPRMAGEISGPWAVKVELRAGAEGAEGSLVYLGPLHACEGLSS